MESNKINVSATPVKSAFLSTKQKAYLALTATSVIWGTTWVVSKIAVQKTPGLEVSYLRQFFAGSILLSFHFYKGVKLHTLQQFK